MAYWGWGSPEAGFSVEIIWLRKEVSQKLRLQILLAWRQWEYTEHHSLEKEEIQTF